MTRPAAIILFAAIVLAGCGPAGTRAVDRRLAAFLPDDAVVLAGLRLDEARATPLGRDLAALATAGLDAHDLLASWDGRQWLIAARVDKGGTVGDVSLTGPPEAVDAAVARHRARRTGPLALLARAPSGKQLWAVSNGAPMVPDFAGYGNVSRLLNAMEDIVAGIDVRDGLRASITGNCRDSANARIVGDAVRALAGVARLQNNVTVKDDGRAVKVLAVIPQAQAESALGRLTRR